MQKNPAHTDPRDAPVLCPEERFSGKFRWCKGVSYFYTEDLDKDRLSYQEKLKGQCSETGLLFCSEKIEVQF